MLFRSMIAGNILKRLVFLHLPAYFQYEVLGEGNILAAENGDIRFSYVFHEPDRFENVTGRLRLSDRMDRGIHSRRALLYVRKVGKEDQYVRKSRQSPGLRIF
mgnify:CR=1 FL=1